MLHNFLNLIFYTLEQNLQIHKAIELHSKNFKTLRKHIGYVTLFTKSEYEQPVENHNH